MRTFKVMALTLAGVLGAGVANAQDEVEVSLGADVVSNYLWRGHDLTVAYTTGGFNIGITDYFFTNQYDGVKYFKYDAHETAHVFEFNVGYDFGPLSVQWFTNFAGADGYNKDGERAYSSYVEFAAPFKLGGLDWSASLGVVPFATSFYSDADGFAVTNLSVKTTKDIKVTDSFSVPVFGQITANPSNGKAYFALGFTLQP